MSSAELELDDAPDGSPARRKVSTVILRAWIHGLDMPERERHALLEELGIEPAILERWDLLVDAELELELVRWAVIHRGPGVGLDAAAALHRGGLSVLEYLMRTADDVGSALQMLIRYQHLLATPPTYARMTEDDVRITLARPYDISSAVEVAIRHAPTTARERYREKLRCTVDFDAAESMLVLDRDLLDRRMTDADPRLQRLLLDCMKSVLGPRALGGRIADEVHAVVLELLPTGRLAVGTVAGQLGLTARTLQDRLKDEGTSYTELLESARRDLAHRYLREDQLSVPDVALLLGYSEASAFHRAFKRWTGLTPRQYRSRRLP
jgi:AraC-like DNA-binding protein